MTDGPHRRLVEPLAPHEADAFVLKGRHSIFWQTSLDYLLCQSGIDRLVLCDQVHPLPALDAHVSRVTP